VSEEEYLTGASEQ